MEQTLLGRWHRLIGDADLDSIGLRFRCSSCGARPTEVWVTWNWVGGFDKDGKPKRDCSGGLHRPLLISNEND